MSTKTATRPSSAAPTGNRFSQLKGATQQLEKLTAEVDKLTSKTEYADDARFWRPEVDKAGNGYAIIRFLPVSEVDNDAKLEYPWVKVYQHAFQGPKGQWYIELSLTTLGKPDPVSEHNSVLWGTGEKEKQEIVRKQKRKLSYISNVLVIKDEKHPENEGKVFLYRYGKKIFEKIAEAMKPVFPDTPKFNPFDLWEGANFRIKIRDLEGYRNYDKSEFETPAPALKGNDAALEELWGKEHSLLEHVAADKFKSYEDLKKRLELVLGTTDASSAPYTTPARPTSVAAPTRSSPAERPVAQAVAGDEDEDMEFFRKLSA